MPKIPSMSSKKLVKLLEKCINYLDNKFNLLLQANYSNRGIEHEHFEFAAFSKSASFLSNHHFLLD